MHFDIGIQVALSIHENLHTSLRKFYLPLCNFNAKSYTEIVDICEKGQTVITYLSNSKGVLNLHEPLLTKTCTNIMQFLKQPLELSYPNHTEAVECGVKLTTKANSRKAGQKRQIGEALYNLAARKKRLLRKFTRVAKSSFVR